MAAWSCHSRVAALAGALLLAGCAQNAPAADTGDEPAAPPQTVTPEQAPAMQPPVVTKPVEPNGNRY